MAENYVGQNSAARRQMPLRAHAAAAFCGAPKPVPNKARCDSKPAHNQAELRNNVLNIMRTLAAQKSQLTHTEKVVAHKTHPHTAKPRFSPLHSRHSSRHMKHSKTHDFKKITFSFEFSSLV